MKTFWKKFINFIIILIVLFLFSYYIMFTAYVASFFYVYDNLCFFYSLIVAYVLSLNFFGSVLDFVSSLYQYSFAFLYHHGYFHLYNVVTQHLYETHILFEVESHFWYKWQRIGLFDNNYWRLNFQIVPFSKPWAYYILPFWQNYAIAYSELDYTYNCISRDSFGNYSLPSLDFYVTRMSGRFLSNEYRFAWISHYYSILKPALIFGEVPRLMYWYNDFFKWFYVFFNKLPEIVKFPIFQYMLMLLILFYLFFNKKWFLRFWSVNVQFKSSLNIVFLTIIVILLGFWIMVFLIKLCVLLYFKFIISFQLLYILSFINVLCFIWCFKTRSSARIYYAQWVSALKKLEYVSAASRVFNYVIILLGRLEKFIARTDKFIYRTYKNWRKDVEIARRKNIIVEFRYFFYFLRYLYIRIKFKNNKHLIKAFVKQKRTHVQGRYLRAIFNNKNFKLIRRYYFYLLALWLFWLTSTEELNRSKHFFRNFYLSHVHAQSLLTRFWELGISGSITYPSVLPTKYSEYFVPISLKGSNGGLWVRSTSYEMSPVALFRNKDYIRFLNHSDYVRSFLWEPNHQYVIYRLDNRFYKSHIRVFGWKKIHNVISGLYSMLFKRKYVSSFIMFYEYYVRLLGVYSVSILKQYSGMFYFLKVNWFFLRCISIVQIYLFIFLRYVSVFVIHIYKPILFLFNHYNLEVHLLRTNPHFFPYLKTLEVFKLKAYSNLNLFSGNDVEIYQHHFVVVANKWTRIIRMFNLSLIGGITFSGLNVKFLGYIWALMSMKIMYLLVRTYERFIFDYLLYAFLSLFYKVWFLSKLFDLIDYNLSFPFYDKVLRTPVRKRHLTNTAFFRERMQCSRYFRYRKKEWYQTARGKALFFHKQPTSFDWNMYL